MIEFEGIEHEDVYSIFDEYVAPVEHLKIEDVNTWSHLCSQVGQSKSTAKFYRFVWFMPNNPGSDCEETVEIYEVTPHEVLVTLFSTFTKDEKRDGE